MGRKWIPWVQLYKRPDRKGRRHKWRVQVRCDELGVQYDKPVSTDYRLAVQYAMKLSEQLERRRLGLTDPGEERRIDARRQPLTRTLEEGDPAWKEGQREGHLEEYRDILIARGNVEAHARDHYQKCRGIVEACKAVYCHELTPAKVQTAVSRMPLSNQTKNHYLTAITCFFNWMKEDGRVGENPLDGRLTRYNVKADKRRVRRIVTLEQLEALIRAAEDGPVFVPPRQKNHAITGPERADVYRTCVGTSQRANEVRQMRVKHLHLDGETPGILIEAKYGKNRRETFQLISPALAEVLRPYTAGRKPEDRVFPRLPQRTAEMLRFDLAAAGIPYADEQGRVFDFHSLRYESGSLLVAQGVNLKVVQAHMRHSSITLTMDRYAKPQLHDQTAAAGAIPTFPRPDPEAKRATGTDAASPFPTPTGPLAPIPNTPEKTDQAKTPARSIASSLNPATSMRLAPADPSLPRAGRGVFGGAGGKSAPAKGVTTIPAEGLEPSTSSLGNHGSADAPDPNTGTIPDDGVLSPPPAQATPIDQPARALSFDGLSPEQLGLLSALIAQMKKGGG